jgi:fructokinase
VLTLCLGEALVDLVCERPVASLAEADAFVPHFGGAVANVAVGAARLGAPVALAGGAGDDAWGRWLRDRLAAEGVDTSCFVLDPESATALAFVSVSDGGEPDYLIYGDAIGAGVANARGCLPAAFERAAAVFLASNTLVGEAERYVTLRTRQAAVDSGRHVIFDANLRVHRWPTPTAAGAAARECVPGALLVKCNLDEAYLMTSERDPEAAARTLLTIGARMVLITLGAEGAILRGEVSLDAPAPPVEVVNAMGAGDAVMAVLIARLAASGFYPPAVHAALPDAMRAGAQACERWGALA